MFSLTAWLPFLIIAGLSSTIFNFISRYLLRNRSDATTFAWYNEALRFVIFAFIAVFNWRLVITFQSFILFVIVGLTEFVGGYFYMKMHEHTELSISTIIYR